MKARRAVLGLFIFGGLLVLILGWAGVFSVRPTVAPAPAPTGPEDGENTLVGKGFRSEGDNWVLTSPQASVALDTEQVTLSKPVLEVDELGGKEGQRLKVEADSGAFEREPVERVALDGNVVVTLTGDQEGVLKTSSLRANMTDRSGETDQPIEVAVSTKDGMQSLQAKGVEFNFAQRSVKILSDVRMEIRGADILPGAPAGTPEAQAAQPASAVPIHVTCDGPCLADGFKRTAQLNGHVLVTQGDRKLAADRLDLQFPKAGVEPDRLVAQGHVNFDAGEASGFGDQLVYTRAEKLLLLSGSPAVVKQDAGEIRADRVEVDATANRISVPVKGALAMSSGEPGAEKMSVKWSNSLRFDSAEHTAVIRGNVHFARAGQTIQCRTLRVHLDDANRGVKECFAEGDVTLDIAPHQMRADALRVLLTPEGQLSGFEATGHVSVEQEGHLLTADKVVAAAGPGGEVKEFVATGHVSVRQSASGEDVERTMTADKAVAGLDEEGQINGFIATGRVVVTEGARKIRAPRIVATIGADKTLAKLVADGGIVSVEETGRIAKGALLEWNRELNTGALTGSPVELRQGRSKLYGDRIEFSKEAGSLRISSGRRVEGSIEPRQSELPGR